MVSKHIFISFLSFLICLSCEENMREKEFGELKTVDFVDLKRFMGDWYVIANIPTIIEKGAVNAVESYELDSGGRINTTFTFRKGALKGQRNCIRHSAFVLSL